MIIPSNKKFGGASGERIVNVNVEQPVSYEETTDFKNAYSSYFDDTKNDEILIVSFLNNSNNNRAGRTIIYNKINQTGMVFRWETTPATKIVAYPSYIYGIGVYQGCTIQFKYIKSIY